MKKKTVHILPIPLAQIIPINHKDVPLLKIIHGKYLS
jgi:hypothetical protein